MSTSESQANILDAVQAVIVRDGVRGASMRQVAQEADVSLGLLSYHFDDKSTLIEAAFERATSDLLNASFEAIRGVEDPEQRVIAFFRGSFADEFLNGDYLRLRISLWAVAITDDNIRAVDQRFYTRYCTALVDQLAAARPSLSAEQLSARASDAIAHVNGLWLDWARFANDDRLERGLRACEAALLADA